MGEVANQQKKKAAAAAAAAVELERETMRQKRKYIGSTEAWSITFNNLMWMQVKCLTAGYVVDRFEDKSLCTTEGKGLELGVLHTIGIPTPTKRNGSKSLLESMIGNDNSDALFSKSYSDRN